MPDVNSVQTVVDRMRGLGAAPALYYGTDELTYDDLMARIDAAETELRAEGVGRGTVVSVLGDYSPATVSLFYALLRIGAILVPFTRNVSHEIPRFMEIAGVQRSIVVATNDQWTVTHHGDVAQNELVEKFRNAEGAEAPGLIVFTSGSTGQPKGILHNAERVMRKFAAPRPGWRTVLFLMMDHFGGFNTLLSTFAYGGAGICISDRSPDTVCGMIERGKATLLPTTPTFLNMLIASRSYRSFDLSSIELITYGTEVMPEATLLKVRSIFPNATIKQTYGLSELGVLRSKSEGDASVWVKIGGDGFEVKIVDNTLWVRSEANMVGYLNAPSPFDGEGWMNTGDQVETRDGYMRILGRKSELIFVGGEKVYPAEVETVLLQAHNVREATVYGVKHPLMGQAVHARISLFEPEDIDVLKPRLRRHCLDRLARFKLPMQFHIVDEGDQRSARFKKVRNIETPAAEG
jgi:long-chain acyl-CoA synthetase